MVIGICDYFMKPKQIIILSVVLGILALGIVLKLWLSSIDDGLAPLQTGNIAIAEFDPAKVDRILFARGTETPVVELVKEKGIWKVKSLWDAKADPVKVEALLQKFHAIRGELRGTGNKLFPDFGIEDKDAFSIRFLGSGSVPLADLRLGKKRAGEDGYFVRKADDDDIYLVGLDMAELFGIFTDLETAKPSSDFWADLSLFELDPGKVTKITVYHIKGDEKTMALGLLRAADPKDPAKNAWKFMRKNMTSPVDPGKVLKFMAVLTSIKAQKVVDPGGKDYGLEKPVWQLAVTEGGKKTFLSAGPKAGKEDLYYVKTSTGTFVLSLDAGYFDDLNIDDMHFVKDALVAKSSKITPQSATARSLSQRGLSVGQGREP